MPVTDARGIDRGGCAASVWPARGRPAPNQPAIKLRPESKSRHTGILHIPVKRQELSKHIETLYVDRPQFATLWLPLTSTGFYPDGNSPGKYMENSGKQNPKMGFKSPPSRDAPFNWLFLKNLGSKTHGQIQNLDPHRLMS